MPLKLEVEKLDDVEEAHRGLYSEKQGGGGFILGVDGLEDTGALKRAKEHEAAARKVAERQVQEFKDREKAAQEAARKAAEEAAAKSGDLETLRKSAEERVATARAEADSKYKPEIESLTSDVNRLLIDNVATTIASQLALQGSESVLIPHISARLGVELRDGKRTTVVKDANGQPSTLSLDDLKKEIAGNKAFAPLLAGTKASGGGASGGKGGGAAGAKSVTRAAFDAMDPATKVAFMRGGGSVTDPNTH